MKLKDLQKIEYEGKKCVAFEYTIAIEGGLKVRMIFSRIHETVWIVNCLVPSFFPDAYFKDSERMLNFTLEIPKEDTMLIKIAEAGISIFQQMLKQEIQMLSGIDFSLGKELESKRW